MFKYQDIFNNCKNCCQELNLLRFILVWDFLIKHVIFFKYGLNDFEFLISFAKWYKISRYSFAA